VGKFLDHIGTTICLEVLNRPSEICAEPRNMVVFGALAVALGAVGLLVLASVTWTDPNRRG
jgi:hypothetical protein